MFRVPDNSGDELEKLPEPVVEVGSEVEPEAEPTVEQQVSPLRPTALRVPNFGHTVLFFTITIVVLLLSGVSILAVAMGLHLMGPETPEQLLREPRVVIPSMSFAYLVTGAILAAVFTWLWQRPFAVGVQWNFGVVRRHWVRLLAGGAALSVVVQLLSYFLPVPKTLPIDDFFRTSGDVWMVALFGTLIAPLFEELAFRGFLLPSLASTWDWVRGRREPVVDQGVAEEWSVPAVVVSCALTSVAFALVHADQLAHAWAPLSVLFGVSLALCAVRLWTKSLAASTFIHATYNGTIFTILFFGTDGFRHLDKIK